MNVDFVQELKKGKKEALFSLIMTPACMALFFLAVWIFIQMTGAEVSERMPGLFNEAGDLRVLFVLSMGAAPMIWYGTLARNSIVFGGTAFLISIVFAAVAGI